jgi:hypothetical protein
MDSPRSPLTAVVNQSSSGLPLCLREVLLRFGELEKHQPKPLGDLPDWPEWVSNLLMILMGISHPGSKLKSMKKWFATVEIERMSHDPDWWTRLFASWKSRFRR